MMSRLDRHHSHVFLLSALFLPANLHCGGQGYFKIVDSDASFSPDGSKIAFCSRRVTPTNSDGDQDIWLMNADGTDQRCLIRNAGHDVLSGYENGGCWSRNGTELLVGLTTGERHWLTGDRHAWEWVVVDLQGRVVKRMSTPPAIGGSPRFHPDGRQLIWAGERGLWLTDLDGNQVKTVSSVGNAYLHTSRDGNRLVFVHLDKSDKRHHATTADLPTGAVNDLGAGWCARISADGRTIAWYPMTGRESIHLMDFDGRNQRHLDHQGDTTHLADMCFSPAGEQLAFCRRYRAVGDGERREQSSLCIADLPERKVREVSGRGPGMTEMQFSPDGRSVVFLGGPHDDLGLYLVRIEDGLERRLTPSAKQTRVASVRAR